MKKLRETLVAVQQLDKNMSSLRSWLAHIETELSRPIVYDTCDDQEIQRKLNQQQASREKTVCCVKCCLRSSDFFFLTHVLQHYFSVYTKQQPVGVTQAEVVANQ